MLALVSEDLEERPLCGSVSSSVKGIMIPILPRALGGADPGLLRVVMHSPAQGLPLHHTRSNAPMALLLDDTGKNTMEQGKDSRMK